jgi:hypothetical protein
MLEVKSSATDSGRGEVWTSINPAEPFQWNKIDAGKRPYCINSLFKIRLKAVKRKCIPSGRKQKASAKFAGLTGDGGTRYPGTWINFYQCTCHHIPQDS